MRIYLLLVAAAAILSPALSAETLTLGEPRTEVATVAIEELLADPTKYTDQRVRIEGLVTGVCPMKGCWMTLAAEQGMEVRVKVEDDVITIPADATGNRASAEGVVRLRNYNRDEWISWQSHLAEEKGETFDEGKVGDGPYQVVSLEGLGIEISLPEGH